ncbi:response regulator [Mucilaginibacter daejeonensis]|uniref:hybrid sensor histidine kinase/response regulator transcription factor n=1 Tax=Mucilaginibacter daejeonensis TaxID=398049 RepID=UPI001D17069E|nr:two-component regulator propeller domain-containing protein [Mucilaginibacter daejeonensis]UEG52261.1 response regulator [Mucilaginibacter daejeonensis]
MLKRTRYYLFIWLCLQLCIGRSYAQNRDIHFTVLSSKDGLPSNTVNAILKDRYGLLWFATEDGLAKFNGLTFNVYRHAVNDPTSISGNEVSSLHEDKAGRLWVGTSGGFLLYDRRRDRFVRYKEDQKGNGLSSVNIKSICSDRKGKIWIATLGGLNILDPETDQVTKLATDRRVPWEISRGEVLSVYCDSHGMMWIGTKNGLFTYTAGNGHFGAFKHRNDDPQSICGDMVKTITEDSAGTMWFGTGSGLSSFDAVKRTFHNITESSTNEHVSSNTIYTLNVGRSQDLWIGTENGLDILDIRSGKISHHYPVGRDVSTISGRSVRSVLNDRDGITWVGTFEAGVNKYDRNLTYFGLKKSNPYDVHGLSAPFVTALAPARNGNIYVGTDGGGLSIYHPETGLFDHVTLNGQGAASSEMKILALEASRNGTLWIGTYQKGLFSLNPASGQVKHYLKGTAENTLNNNDIFCLKEDRAGRLWIGTNGGGVNILDQATGSIVRYGPPAEGQGMQYLPLNGYIRSLTEDNKGRMWIGSYGTGIAIYDPAKKNFELLGGSVYALPSNKMNSFWQDASGAMWVGTGGDGLMPISEDLTKIDLIRYKMGLADGVIHKVLGDKSGRIWMSTNRGVSWLDPTKGRVVNYSYHNGLQNSSFKNGSGMISNDGTLYFGGGEGLNFIDPRTIKFNRRSAEIIFTEFRIGNRVISGKDSTILDADIAVAKGATLAYKQNFSISFVALNFTSPRQNSYHYRLKGFDRDWISAGNKTTAYYTNLSPGKYIFEVKATNNDGIVSQHTASIEINIEPPFWMTIWAYLLYLALAGSALLLLRYRGIRKLRREFLHEQSKMEAERLHELDKLKIKFLTNLSHDLRTPISLIMGPVEKLLHRSQLEGDSVVQLRLVKRNARRLLNLVNQLLDFRKIEERELKLNLTTGDVIGFIKEVCESFQDLSEKKQIAFVVTTAIDRLNIPFDADKLERILFNLLSNAFKFSSEGGKVMLVAYLKNALQDDGENALILEISDTGIGIDQNSQAYIFERFYQSRGTDSIADQGSGIGLSIVREFVQLHGGQITVDSVQGEGTKFKIELPFVANDRTLLAEPDRDATATEGEDQTVIIDDTIAHHERPAEQTAATGEHLPLILIVEDNEDFRFFLRDNLKPYYKIIEAANGKEGWQKALASHPELIVSDITMPFMDGLELSQKLKADKRTSHIPIILLTASSGEEKQLKGLASGANDYLNKPFSLEILNIRIKNLLSFNRTLKQTYAKQVKLATNEPQVESANEKFLRSVVKYIEDNLTNTQLSVEDLSRHIGMSRGSLYNKLLEITGLSPVEFIRSIKLEKAAMLLENSDLNIAQIAYTVGFATPNYFAKSFKAKYEILPSEYLNQKRKPARSRSGQASN